MQSKNKSEWRVSAFDLKTGAKSRKKSKRKRSKPKNIIYEENKSPIPFKELTNNPDVTKRSELTTSPVLNKRCKLNDETSPVITKNKKGLIKLKKEKLSFKNKQNCVKKLMENVTEDFTAGQKNDLQDRNIVNTFQHSVNGVERITIENEEPSVDCKINIDQDSERPLEIFSQVRTHIATQNSPNKYIEEVSPSQSPDVSLDFLERAISINLSQSPPRYQKDTLITLSPVFSYQLSPKRSQYSYKERCNISPQRNKILFTQNSLKIDSTPSPQKQLEDSDLLNSPILYPLELSPKLLQSRKETIHTNLVYNDKISSTQLSMRIDLSQSPKKFITQDREGIQIEACSSQETAVVTISSNSTLEDSLEKKPDEDTEFFPRKHRKKYKPGTFSYQLQKLLQKQKNDVALWKHEIYLALTTDFQPPVNTVQSVVMFDVIKVIHCHSVLLLECFELPNREKCLVLPDPTYVQNLDIQSDTKINVYPDYFVKFFKIRDDSIKVFLNVHKIVKCI